MAQALQDILATLDPIYNPEKALVQKQIDSLPGQQTADQAGLDTAKTNAFGDINIQANNRGLSYSGMPIAEQTKYVGTKYLPAVAALKTNYANKGSALQQSLLGIEQKRQGQAQTIQSGQVANDIAAKKAADDLAIRQQEAQASIARSNRVATPRQSNPAAGFGVSRDKGGGYQYHGANGAPINAVQYYSGIGGNIQDLGAAFAASGNKGDQQIAQDIQKGLSQQELAQKYPWVGF